MVAARTVGRGGATGEDGAGAGAGSARGTTPISSAMLGEAAVAEDAARGAGAAGAGGALVGNRSEAGGAGGAAGPLEIRGIGSADEAGGVGGAAGRSTGAVSYTHLRAHETPEH